MATRVARSLYTSLQRTGSAPQPQGQYPDCKTDCVAHSARFSCAKSQSQAPGQAHCRQIRTKQRDQTTAAVSFAQESGL